MSRASVQAALETFRRRISARGLDITSQEWQELERELAIVVSIRDDAQRSDEAIQVAVQRVKDALAAKVDPRHVLERLLVDAPIPYDLNKGIQWCAAYIYRIGYDAGRKGAPPPLVR